MEIAKIFGLFVGVFVLLQQEVEITRKLNEALRQREADPEKLQAAILDRCSVALEIEPLCQALRDLRQVIGSVKP